ncbi:MAG: hypothetical protein K8R60_21810 [Burkholderiales bacterium]|nr:hypothetical protein [Burkholderiales bacterium]
MSPSRIRGFACGLASALAVAAGVAPAADEASVVAPVVGNPPTILTAPEDRRTPDQTFLTFPEWYLVHSPAEYARFLARSEPPSSFPLFAHIGQFWQGYHAVNREVARYPFNAGYHLMVMVIGTSTTVEYALRGIYEHTIGRVAEATVGGSVPVAEERLHAAYAQAYVDFIRIEPWYKFDFVAPLAELWSDLPLSGPNLIRRWERRFALTTELLVKEGYARLIKLGTQSVYDAPKPVTAVVLSKAPEPDVATWPDYAASKTVGSGEGPEVLATIPRYEAFTAYSRWLAGQGIDFREIAGNDGEVLVSVIVPAAWMSSGPGRTLFEQPIITRPGQKRVVLAVRVNQLATLLRSWGEKRGGVLVEHIYDF